MTVVGGASLRGITDYSSLVPLRGDARIPLPKSWIRSGENKARNRSGRSAAWLARCTGGAEVGSSNLLAPTILPSIGKRLASRKSSSARGPLMWPYNRASDSLASFVLVRAEARCGPAEQGRLEGVRCSASRPGAGAVLARRGPCPFRILPARMCAGTHAAVATVPSTADGGLGLHGDGHF